MAELSSGAFFFIKDSRGNRQLRHIESLSSESGGSSEPVVGAGGVIGTSDTPGAATFQLVVTHAVGVPDEVHWAAMQQTKELFDLTEQLVSGQGTYGMRTQWTGCKVSSVSRSTAAGNVRLTVSCIANDPPRYLEAGQ